MIAAAVAVFGYIKLGNVYDVSGTDVTSRSGVAGENEDGRERVPRDAKEELPSEGAGGIEGAGHGNVQVDQDLHDPAGE